MEFNEKLQQLRKAEALTQEELAEDLFVSRTAVSKWEAGRGYPSIDSLRAISKRFHVSIDDLLSSEELISIAENDSLEKTRSLRDLVFGVLDCMLLLFLFLPLFAQREPGLIREVSLLALSGLPSFLRTAYFLVLGLTVVFGVAELVLRNVRHRLWVKNKTAVSLTLTVTGALLFIASQQPYAAALLLCLLVVKGVLLLKRQ